MPYRTSLASQIEARLSDYIRSPNTPTDLRGLAQTLGALPIYADLGGCLLIRPNCELLEVEWDDDSEPTNLIEPRERSVALVLGAEKYPELSALLPPRPADVRDCVHCGGKGRIHLPEIDAPPLCGPCGARGWIDRAMALDAYGATVHPLAEGEPFSIVRNLEGDVAVAVCDGSASWGPGFEASRLGGRVIAETLLQSTDRTPDRMRRAFTNAQRSTVDAFYKKEEFSPSYGAVAAYVTPEAACIGWAGDCFACVVRQAQIVHYTGEEAKALPHQNVWATAIVGDDRDPETVLMDIAGPWDLQSGDYLLLGSSEVEIAESAEPDIGGYTYTSPRHAVERMLEAAHRAQPQREHSLVAIRVV